MISFDASDIANWADKPDAPHQMPELVWRLVLATAPMPSFLDMPSGSSVRLPGWGGLLVVESGNAWIPDGATPFARVAMMHARLAETDLGDRVARVQSRSEVRR